MRNTLLPAPACDDESKAWIESRKLKEVLDMWMNIHTGSVSPMGNWDDFEYWRDAGSLVEVRKSTTEQEKEEYGEWTGCT